MAFSGLVQLIQDLLEKTDASDTDNLIIGGSTAKRISMLNLLRYIREKLKIGTEDISEVSPTVTEAINKIDGDLKKVTNDVTNLKNQKYNLAGMVCHYYSNGSVSCGSTSGTYINVPAFTNGSANESFAFLYEKNSNNKITVKKTGVYSFQLRLGINAPTVNKRVEFVPFINGSRFAGYSTSYTTPANYTLTNWNNYILSLNEGDEVEFKAAPVESVAVNVNIIDIFIHAFDWDGKFA